MMKRFLYWEFHERDFQQAVRWKDWKAVRTAHDKPLELYNLDGDVAETKNVAAENTNVVQHIEGYLTAARTNSSNWPAPIDADP